MKDNTREIFIIESFLKRVVNYLRLVRFWEWQGRLQIFIVCGFLLWVFSGSDHFPTKEFLVLIIYLHFAYSYGYGLNSLADRRADLVISRDNFCDFSRRFLISTVVFNGFFTIVIAWFLHNIYIFTLTIIGLLLATFYSLKPICFKEKGMLALFVSALSHSLPFLFFVFLLKSHYWLMAYLFGWMMILGFFLEISQQIGDYFNDQLTQTRTFARDKGVVFTKKVVYLTGALLLLYLVPPAFVEGVYGALVSLVLLAFSKDAVDYAIQRVGLVNAKLKVINKI